MTLALFAMLAALMSHTPFAAPGHPDVIRPCPQTASNCGPHHPLH